MRTDSPTARAFWQLSDLARIDGYGDARLFALVWLAAGRMVSRGNVPGVSSIEQLADLSTWKALGEAGFPVDALSIVAAQRLSASAQELGRRASAADIVADLDKQMHDHVWDVLPCLTAGTSRGGAEGAIIPELASLLLDLVGEPDGELWIPFDSTGQLLVSALRRSWRVLSASPMPSRALMPQLLLTIEAGQARHPGVRDDVERDGAGHPISRADYSLVIPPWGVQVRDSRMALWDGGRTFEKFARSESWAIHEFVNRTNRRAVFVAPQGVLFAKGQEQRLREYLIHRGGESNEVEAVLALPPGVFASTGIAGAALVVNPGGGTDAVYMADLGSGRRSLLEAGDIVEAGRAVALRQGPTDKGRDVSRDEIAANEYSFSPSRYLRRVADFDAEAVKLGSVCAALRPPMATKEPSPFAVSEVGMQDLTMWRPINQAPDKTVFLKAPPKDSALVRPGDLVISIKGTVGKAALIGAAARERPLVVSQSCLALRLEAGQAARNLSPEYLLMYLRSPHGQAQIESLQVGAGVQHISPSTLLGSVLIPIPTEEKHRSVRENYDRLCKLEDNVAHLQQEITHLARYHWPVGAI